MHVGLGWYHHEAELIRRMTPDWIDGDRSIVAAAILSPQTAWERLLEAYGPWLHGEPVTLPAFRSRIELADAVLTGDAWIPPFDRSPKIHSFARNLLGEVEPVTIDIWMLRAMHLDPRTSLKVKGYKVLADDVRAAARLVKVPPRDFQAVVWTHTRGTTEL